MQTKSTLILLILVLLTGGYIWVFERTAQESAVYHELDARAIRFSPESLRSLRVKMGELEYECVRTDGNWTLSYPVMARVSPERLNQVVSGLASRKRHDTIPVSGLDDLKQYGFDEPRVRLEIADNQGTKTWLIGRDAPLGDMVYVMEEGAEEASVTDALVLKMIPRNVEDIRDRSIFPRNLATVTRIDIRREAGFLQLGADAEGAWRIQQPVVSAAENGAVGQLLDAVLQTSIAQFVADEVTDMTSYGLQDPRAQIMLASGEETGVGLLIGNPVPDNAGLVYAKQTEEYAIFAVSTNVLAMLQVDVDLMRDRHLLPMAMNRVRTVALQHADNGRLVFSRAGSESWTLIEPRRWDVDPVKVAMFMHTWQVAQVEQLVVIKDGEEDPRGELATTLTFTGSEASDQYVINLYHPQSEGALAFCSREGEDMLFTYDPVLLNLVGLKALDFKNRNILSLSSKNVTKITQDYGTNSTVLERGESGDFSEASAERLSSFWSVVQDLKALDYVKENPESLAEYGLVEPRCRVTLSLRDADEIGRVLLIGDPCDKGSYAMLQGVDIVFVVSEDAAQILCASLRAEVVEKMDEQ